MCCANSCNVGPDNDNIMNCHCDCSWKYGGGRVKVGERVGCWGYCLVILSCLWKKGVGIEGRHGLLNHFLSISFLLPPRLACYSPHPRLPGFSGNSGDEVERELIRYALSFIYRVILRYSPISSLVSNTAMRNDAKIGKPFFPHYQLRYL